MMEELIRKAYPDAKIVRIDNPKTVKRQIVKATRLGRTAHVIVLCHDLDELCKNIDPDSLAEMIGGLEFHEEKTN